MVYISKNICGFALTGSSLQHTTKARFHCTLKFQLAYLSCAKPNDKIGNECVLSFPTAMGHHDAPAGLLRHFTCFDSLGHRTDLVDFQKQRVAGSFGDGIAHTFGVGYQEIVPGEKELPHLLILLWGKQLLAIHRILKSFSIKPL